jgi:hypothetical protein
MNVLLEVIRWAIAVGVLFIAGFVFLSAVYDFFHRKPPTGGIGAA